MFDASIRGNATADAVLKVAKNTGQEFVEFTIAHNEYKKNQDGTYEDIKGPRGHNVTTFYSVVVFPKDGDNSLFDIAAAVTKGQRVHVDGAIQRRDYETNEGYLRTAWSIKFVRKIEVIARGNAGADGSPASAEKETVAAAGMPF